MLGCTSEGLFLPLFAFAPRYSRGRANRAIPTHATQSGMPPAVSRTPQNLHGTIISRLHMLSRLLLFSICLTNDATSSRGERSSSRDGLLACQSGREGAVVKVRRTRTTESGVSATGFASGAAVEGVTTRTMRSSGHAWRHGTVICQLKAFGGGHDQAFSRYRR